MQDDDIIKSPLLYCTVLYSQGCIPRPALWGEIMGYSMFWTPQSAAGVPVCLPGNILTCWEYDRGRSCDAVVSYAAMVVLPGWQMVLPGFISSAMLSSTLDSLLY